MSVEGYCSCLSRRVVFLWSRLRAILLALRLWFFLLLRMRLWLRAFLLLWAFRGPRFLGARHVRPLLLPSAELVLFILLLLLSLLHRRSLSHERVGCGLIATRLRARRLLCSCTRFRSVRTGRRARLIGTSVGRRLGASIVVAARVRLFRSRRIVLTAIGGTVVAGSIVVSRLRGRSSLVVVVASARFWWTRHIRAGVAVVALSLSTTVVIRLTTTVVFDLATRGRLIGT